MVPGGCRPKGCQVTGDRSPPKGVPGGKPPPKEVPGGKLPPKGVPGLWPPPGGAGGRPLAARDCWSFLALRVVGRHLRFSMSPSLGLSNGQASHRSLSSESFGPWVSD